MRFFLSVGALVVLTLAACGKRSGTSLELDYAGQQPRRPLRFDVKVGDEQSCAMDMDMSMTMKLGSMQMPAVTPPTMRMNMDLSVAHVAENGDITVQAMIDGLELDDVSGGNPEIARALDEVASLMSGMSASMVLTNRGVGKSVDFQLPAGAPPGMQNMMGQLKQSIAQIAAPFPEEAVGVGARWKLYTTIESGGLVLDQVADVELARLYGYGGTLRMKIEQSADRQRVTAPGMPKGAKVELVSLESRGDGELEFDLTKLVPVHSSLNLNSKIKMKMEFRGESQELEMQLTMRVGMNGS